MSYLIYSDSISSGLSRDVEILLDNIPNGRRATSVCDKKTIVQLKRKSPNVVYDAVFILENINPYLLVNIGAHNYIYIPNMEMMEEWDVKFLPQMDYIICKTENTYTKFRKDPILREKAIYTKFQSNITTKDIKKSKKIVFHPAGSNFMKGTEYVIKAWLQSNFSKSTLFITRKRMPYGNDDLKFWDSLNPTKGTVDFTNRPDFIIKTLSSSESLPSLKRRGSLVVEYEKYKNVILFDHIPKSIFDKIADKAFLTLTPSLAEGFGHSINEAMGRGSIVITTNSPPMNEMVKDRRFLVKVVKQTTNKKIMPWKKYLVNYPMSIPDISDMTKKITTVFNLTESECKQIREDNQKMYANRERFFRRSFTKNFAKMTKKKTPGQVFDKIYKNNLWNMTEAGSTKESLSGPGSTVESTKNTRRILSKFIKKYNITSILDLACGDMKWMPLLLADHPKIKFTGYDISKFIIEKNKAKYPSMNFKVVDFTDAGIVLPKVDLILTREVLQHIPNKSIIAGIKNIVASNSKYFVSTNYASKGEETNRDIHQGQAHYVDLTAEPFALTRPREWEVSYVSKFAGGKVFLCLWDLSKPIKKSYVKGGKKHVQLVKPGQKVKPKRHSNGMVEYRVGDSDKAKSKFAYDWFYHMSVEESDTVIYLSLRNGYLFEKYTVMFVNSYIEEDGIFVDIGGNIGCISIPVANMVPKGKVHSFEPFERTIEVLKYNIKKNKIKNIVVYPNAVGHKNMNTTLSNTVMDVDIKTGNISEKSMTEHMNSGSVRLGSKGQKVKMTTLDSRVFDKLDFIKVDVEGAESLVFYGAKKTIKEHVPIIIFEKNFQVISQDMISSMNLPKSVYQFDVVEYCASLGYDTIVKIPRDNFALLHKKHVRIINDDKVQFRQIPNKEFNKKYKLYEMKKPSW
jgi:FkbM family methyltransferase